MEEIEPTGYLESFNALANKNAWRNKRERLQNCSKKISKLPLIQGLGKVANGGMRKV